MGLIDWYRIGSGFRKSYRIIIEIELKKFQ